ncbi:MAG: lipid-A-disaccharide synthase [Acidobacteriota bacterium]|nr:lipid-A-disaccharide synthase [Acidobacteriota bacterium]
MSGTLLVIAGEASGDLHGAELLREIKARRPDLRIIGIGGDGMAPYLDRQLAHVKDLGVVGFIEVVKHLPALNRLFKQVLQAAREEMIEAALFIDYPGLNLRLAKSLRSSMPAVKLHQYVCPQVWAWKKGRIPELGRVLDTLYCLFDFEPALFKGLPVEAIWVGNPLVETVKPEVDREAFFSGAGLDPSKPLVALLPGSREGEIQRLLPPMAELARRWRGDSNHRDVQWALPVAPTLSDGFIQPFLKGAPILPLRSCSYAARAYAAAALVASGTATLETALLGTPFAIVYKLNPLTYAMAKAFVKLPYFGLANVVAGRAVVEELVQGQVNPDELSKVLERLLDPPVAKAIRADLGTVRPHLGEPGAAARVAEHLLHSMEAPRT